ncbi:TPA: glycosyltransferase, partial [Escherichia coli]|nr:glycosyltransferase [Escherichia coli]
MDELKYPLVSIIMPAYNSQYTIKDTIQSVLKQTYPNWELLITDDLSSDS